MAVALFLLVSMFRCFYICWDMFLPLFCLFRCFSFWLVRNVNKHHRIIQGTLLSAPVSGFSRGLKATFHFIPVVSLLKDCLILPLQVSTYGYHLPRSLDIDIILTHYQWHVAAPPTRHWRYHQDLTSLSGITEHLVLKRCLISGNFWDSLTSLLSGFFFFREHTMAIQGT